MRKLLLSLSLLTTLVACKKDDDNNNTGIPTNPGADWTMATLSISTTNIHVDDLPAPDTNASVTNYPQVLMERPMAAAFQAPAGFVVNLFEEHMPEARNLAIAPNGDVFVAQQDMNRISVLRDLDNDGHADIVFTWAEGGILNRPYGMKFYQSKFYVATSGALYRYDYTNGQTAANGTPAKLAEYPAGGQHPARGLAIDTVSNRIYIGIGATVNVGMEDNPKYASIQQYNLDGSDNTPYATGIRNPQGLAINYAGGARLCGRS